MNFLTFFTYFAGSMLLYNLVTMITSHFVRKYAVYRLKKGIESGKIQVVTTDQALAEEGDQTWN